MSLFTASINSGSNGNCYYVGNKNEAVLVDVGISCRELEKRMLRCGLNIKKVKAIFITHEHSDHISGLQVTSKKYDIPVFINEGTISNSRLKIEKHLINHFENDTTIEIGGLKINPFAKRHDAADPCSFIISDEHTTVGVMTDIGSVCNDVIKYFKTCHAVYLETNYDEEMLMTGAYPYYLKKRISADHGHLSNKQALELFLNHRHENLSHIFLSHLSKDNNDPQLAHKLFSGHAGQISISVASRHVESPVFEINALIGNSKEVSRQLSLL